MRTDNLSPESTYDLYTAFDHWYLDRQNARVEPSEEDIVEFFEEWFGFGSKNVLINPTEQYKCQSYVKGGQADRRVRF